MLKGNPAQSAFDLTGELILSRGLLTGLLLSIYCASASAQSYVPGEVIVKLKSDHGTSGSYAFMGKANADKEMTLKQSFGKMNMYHYALKKGQSVEAAVGELRADPEVLYA